MGALYICCVAILLLTFEPSITLLFRKLYLVKAEDGCKLVSIVNSVGLEVPCFLFCLVRFCVRVFTVFVKDAMAFFIALKLCLVSSISCVSLRTCDAIDRASSLDLPTVSLEFVLDEEEEPNPARLPGFDGTQHAWVQFLASKEPKHTGFASGFAPNPACLGLVEPSTLGFLVNPGAGFARNPSMPGSRLGSHRTQHAWVWWNPARLGSVPCEHKEPKRAGFASGFLQTQHAKNPDEEGKAVAGLLQVLGSIFQFRMLGAGSGGGFEALGFVSNPAAIGSNIY
ncbi:hypothetical protein SLEP1_g12498 [Rubroshorea leprosula]|uniref:Uncharacterized protein n=1 Tax=Rubroshorea leprosula TaxID=152421 RepID=A0AAV5IP48_9ROSI|nr:hypothetical protein SLEP1_g12498 [Rubroshorea leprosula]